jgi:MFS family permease
MSDIQMTIRELYVYIIIGGAILGALFGLVPLMLGRKRNRARLGLYGFIASIVGGAIGPLLGLIVAGIFSWLVLREKPASGGTSTPDAGDDSASAE